MNRRVSTIFYFIIFATMFAASAFAQADASNGSNRPQPKEDLPKNIKETMAKQRIAREKKDYEELLQRSEEAVKISDELEKSFTDSNQLNSEDQKKLDRLEKLVKKIRTELGANNDNNDDNDPDEKDSNPSTMVNAFKTLQSNAAQLFDEIKKSTRYSVSVLAIQSSNALLRLVKFIRFGK